MPRNTGSQPGAMVTDRRIGSGVAIFLAAFIVGMIAAYAFWPVG